MWKVIFFNIKYTEKEKTGTRIGSCLLGSARSISVPYPMTFYPDNTCIRPEWNIARILYLKICPVLVSVSNTRLEYPFRVHP